MLYTGNMQATVTTIGVDPVTLTPERYQAYNMLVASKVGEDARAFMCKDENGYPVVECWSSNVEAKQALFEAMKEIDK